MNGRKRKISLLSAAHKEFNYQRILYRHQLPLPSPLQVAMRKNKNDYKQQLNQRLPLLLHPALIITPPLAWLHTTPSMLLPLLPPLSLSQPRQVQEVGAPQYLNKNQPNPPPVSHFVTTSEATMTLPIPPKKLIFEVVNKRSA